MMSKRRAAQTRDEQTVAKSHGADDAADTDDKWTPIVKNTFINLMLPTACMLTCIPPPRSKSVPASSRLCRGSLEGLDAVKKLLLTHLDSDTSTAHSMCSECGVK